MSKNEIVSLIETMNNYDELASKAKAKADAIRDALNGCDEFISAQELHFVLQDLQQKALQL